jgi:putative endonuclease
MYLYILKGNKNSFYVGISEDPQRRLTEHNAGKVQSTKSNIPWEIVHLELLENRVAARKREKYLKPAAGRRFRSTLGL